MTISLECALERKYIIEKICLQEPVSNICSDVIMNI